MREARSAYIERQLRALVPTLLAVNRRAGSTDAELSEHIVRLVMMFLPTEPKRPPTVRRPEKAHVRWADIRDAHMARAEAGEHPGSQAPDPTLAPYSPASSRPEADHSSDATGGDACG